MVDAQHRRPRRRCGVRPRASCSRRASSTARLEEPGHHELADVVEQRRGRRLGRRAVRRARGASSSAASDAATEWRQSSPSPSPYCGQAVVEAAPDVRPSVSASTGLAPRRITASRTVVISTAARAPRRVRRPEERRGEGLVELHDLHDLARAPGAPAHTSAASRVALGGQRLQLGGGPGQLVEVDHALLIGTRGRGSSRSGGFAFAQPTLSAAATATSAAWPRWYVTMIHTPDAGERADEAVPGDHRVGGREQHGARPPRAGCRPPARSRPSRRSPPCTPRPGRRAPDPGAGPRAGSAARATRSPRVDHDRGDERTAPRAGPSVQKPAM